MKNLATFVEYVMNAFLSKRRNKKLCSTTDLWNDYFRRAEPGMERQWNEIIWPIIKDFNFETVLELAPGAGRNTEKLTLLADTIHAVDFNEYALDELRARFHDYEGKCKLYFHKNNGSDLEMIENNSITAIYCWDAAVHFDKLIVRDYVREFSRVLKPGGEGFIHHSNLGPAAKPDISQNPHWRSNMSKDLFLQYCERVGLQIVEQIDLEWGEITDCISVFRKEAVTRS
jgi:ubiquinone/menaquinone biosynthesis C-methylase UbiE